MAVGNSNGVSEEGTLSIYLKEIGKHPTLSIQREKELASLIRKGDPVALNLLIKSNLRFVVSVARNYQNQGLGLCDLINEGNLGLIRAARRFDERKNFKFISYAVWWIRQAILQALAEQSRIIKLPLNRVGIIHRIGKMQAALEQRFHRSPNPSEIARELRIDVNEVHETMKIGNGHSSLDAPLEAGKDFCMIDFLYDDSQDIPDTEVICYSLQKEINRTLDVLSGREKEVVKMYFGVGKETTHTLDEIGARFNITRERARQIKEKAIDKLRRAARDNGLMNYFK
ncbi:MAG: RNA polymerase sigma factor RpoD/SigA [Chitinispirillaceae bacterium]